MLSIHILDRKSKLKCYHVETTIKKLHVFRGRYSSWEEVFNTSKKKPNKNLTKIKRKRKIKTKT